MAQWSGSSFASDGRVVRSNNLDPAHLEESEWCLASMLHCHLNFWMFHGLLSQQEPMQPTTT